MLADRRLREEPVRERTMETQCLERVRRAFERRFGKPTLLVRSPGRVNLIGEHTDYNQGFVLPGAVDKAIWLAVAPRGDERCRFFAVDFGEAYEASLESLAKSEVHWANYLLGVLSELMKDGHRPRGLDCAFGGDVPIGSGLSSSAALECGFAFALNELFALGYDREDLARLGQRSENRFVGVRCGIMDQFASLLGREGRVLRLDCRDLTYEYVPFERRDVRLVLCDTQVRRALAASEYNVRRAQCEAGVATIARHHPEVRSLREVTLEMLEIHRSELDPVVYRRCAYVVQENRRVVEACVALAQGDFVGVGRLMDQSHAGLRDEYEVSSAELDALAGAARAVPGVLGSRMMGAGFGGCTIHLVEEGALALFEERMTETFRQKLRKEPVVHVCRLTAGTEVVS
jgi:galactokinase